MERVDDDQSACQLFIGDLSRLISEEDLRKLFAPYGEITALEIKRDKFTQFNLGFGFVNYRFRADAERALNACNGFEIGNRRIRISWAQKNTTLVVSHVCESVSVAHLRAVFGQFGPIVEEDSFQLDLEENGSYFIRYCHRADAEKAKEALTNHMLGKRQLRIGWADKMVQKHCVYLQFNCNQAQQCNISEELLGRFFEQFGAVVSVSLPRSLNTKRLKGFAFVHYSNDKIGEQRASVAVQAVNASGCVGNIVVRCSFGKRQGKARAPGGGPMHAGGGGGGYGEFLGNELDDRELAMASRLMPRGVSAAVLASNPANLIALAPYAQAVSAAAAAAEAWGIDFAATSSEQQQSDRASRVDFSSFLYGSDSASPTPASAAAAAGDARTGGVNTASVAPAGQSVSQLRRQDESEETQHALEPGAPSNQSGAASGPPPQGFSREIRDGGERGSGAASILAGQLAKQPQFEAQRRDRGPQQAAPFNRNNANHPIQQQHGGMYDFAGGSGHRMPSMGYGALNMYGPRHAPPPEPVEGFFNPQLYHQPVFAQHHYQYPQQNFRSQQLQQQQQFNVNSQQASRARVPPNQLHHQDAVMAAREQHRATQGGQGGYSQGKIYRVDEDLAARFENMQLLQQQQQQPARGDDFAGRRRRTSSGVYSEIIETAPSSASSTSGYSTSFDSDRVGLGEYMSGGSLSRSSSRSESPAYGSSMLRTASKTPPSTLSGLRVSTGSQAAAAIMQNSDFTQGRRGDAGGYPRRNRSSSTYQFGKYVPSDNFFLASHGRGGGGHAQYDSGADPYGVGSGQEQQQGGHDSWTQQYQHDASQDFAADAAPSPSSRSVHSSKSAPLPDLRQEFGGESVVSHLLRQPPQHARPPKSQAGSHQRYSSSPSVLAAFVDTISSSDSSSESNGGGRRSSLSSQVVLNAFEDNSSKGSMTSSASGATAPAAISGQLSRVVESEQ